LASSIKTRALSPAEEILCAELAMPMRVSVPIPGFWEMNNSTILIELLVILATELLGDELVEATRAACAHGSNSSPSRCLASLPSAKHRKRQSLKAFQVPVELTLEHTASDFTRVPNFFGIRSGFCDPTGRPVVKLAGLPEFTLSSPHENNSPSHVGTPSQ
jgi:hypothetical protein